MTHKRSVVLTGLVALGLAVMIGGAAALQFSVYSGTLDWKDPVTDEQYLGKK